MGQIKFKWFYTELVEAFMRAVVRNRKKYLTTEWWEFTVNWIENLSEEDRDFIQFVFSEEYYYSSDGVACYSSDKKTYFSKREWLFSIEKKFAIDAGLIADQTESENSKKNTHKH